MEKLSEEQKNPEVKEELKQKSSLPRKPQVKKLSRLYRGILYLLVLSIESVCNVSGGLLSSSSVYIKKSLSMSDTEFGFFSTANSSGRVIGSFIFMLMNQRFSRKWILVISLFLKSICLIAFKLTNKKYLLIAIRFCIGFSHMPATNYCAAWIDQYAFQSMKNVQMTAVDVVRPAGKCLGYLIHIIVGQEKWQNGFVIEGVYIFFVCFCYTISSEDYFSRIYFPKKHSKEKEERQSDATLYEEDINQIINSNIKSNNKEKDIIKKHSFFEDFTLLISNAIFLLAMFCRCVIFGLNSGLHFWISDYMRNVIKVESSYTIFTSYTVICVAGPFGGLIANAILRPFVGSYDSRKASWPLVILQVFVSCFAISFTLVNDMTPFITLLVGYFIFISIVNPLLQGVLISSVEKRLKVTAQTITSIATQILTSGSVPVLYGRINDIYKGIEGYSHLAMKCMMSLQFMSVPFLAILAILRNRKFDLEKERQKENEKVLIEKEKNNNNDNEEIELKELNNDSEI